jgi:predicted nucleic acid-binding protein
LITPRPTLVDANVLLDFLTNDPTWGDWAVDELRQARRAGPLVINQLIYAEVSVGFERIEELDLELRPFERRSVPWPAAFLAGKAFLAYRRAGGSRRSPMADFYIGAHAATDGMALLTRDPAVFRTYFPRLELIAP